MYLIKEVLFTRIGITICGVLPTVKRGRFGWVPTDRMEAEYTAAGGGRNAMVLGAQQREVG